VSFKKYSITLYYSYKKKKKKTGTIINGREISKDYREKGKIIDIFDTNDPNKREE